LEKVKTTVASHIIWVVHDCICGQHKNLLSANNFYCFSGMKTFLNTEPDPVFRLKKIFNKMFYGMVKFHFLLMQFLKSCKIWKLWTKDNKLYY